MGETTIITPAVDTAHTNDGNAEYEARMVAKADGGLGSTPEPKLFAGKYKSEEDLNKGILELIKKQSNGNLEEFYLNQQKAFGAPAKEAEKPAEVEKKKETEDLEKKVDETEKELEKATGRDFTKYATEYEESGALAEESIAELVASGIPAEMVNGYIKGMDALKEANQAVAYNLVGGKDEYMAMLDFASTNIPKEDALAFNEAIKTDKRDEAIKGLYARYTEANPKFIEGGSQIASGGEGYATENEFKAARRDPRYKKDASYRDTVARKLAASKLL